MAKYLNDINFIDKSGYGLLHIACFENIINSVDILIKKGCNLNIRDTGYGMTPLMVAIVEEYSEIAKKLVQNEAKIYLEDNNKMTALEYAIVTKNYEITKLIYDVDPKLERYSKEAQNRINRILLNINFK